MTTRVPLPSLERTRSRRRARRALALYELPRGRAALGFVATSFNTVYCLRVDRQPVAALRVGARQRIHAEGTEEVEAAWMHALRRDGVVSPPAVIGTSSGAASGRVAWPGEDAPRVCVLFEWVPGPRLAMQMSAAGAAALGRVAALLHVHGASAGAPAPAGVLVADRTLYWRLPNLLGTVAGHGALLSEALARADAAVGALFADPPHPPHLVHGDLSANNALVVEAQLVPIDFQDLVVGLDVQDVTFSLASFSRFPGAAELQAHFRRGYAAVRPFPDPGPELLAALTAARRLQQLNLALALGGPRLPAATQRLSAAVAAWMGASAT